MLFIPSFTAYPPHPPDSCPNLFLETLDQLAVGGNEGLLGLNLDCHGLLRSEGNEAISFFSKFLDGLWREGCHQEIQDEFGLAPV